MAQVSKVVKWQNGTSHGYRYAAFIMNLIKRLVSYHLLFDAVV